MVSPHEGKQGRHPNACLCSTHMTKLGVQHVAPPIAPVEVSQMPLDPNVLSALSTMPEALASYIQSQTATPTATVPAMPITQAPIPPVVVGSVVALPAVVAPTVVPTAEIVIPLTELSQDRPKKAGFYRYVDGRAGLPAQFDHKTEAVRISKMYISPLWSGGRESNLEIVIRQRAS